VTLPLLVDQFGRHITRLAPPAEVADAVEGWARAWGRHGRLEWHALLQCWCIHFTRRESDPMRRLVQEGRSDRGETESVMLHEPAGPGQGYRAVDIAALGAGGMVDLLNRRNLWSGRGEHASLQDAIDAALAADERRNEARLDEAYESGRERGARARRTALRLPLVSVPRDIN
jgi:hypothetical protein